MNFSVCSRHEDLKQMLDVNKDSLKLEAMKRIIGVSEESRIFVGDNFYKNVVFINSITNK